MKCDGLKLHVEKILAKKPGGEKFYLKNPLAKSLTAKILHKKHAVKSKRAVKNHAKKI